MSGLLAVLEMLGNTVQQLEAELERLRRENEALRQRLAEQDTAGE